MLETLKKEVYLANLELINKGMVIYTWGNVSARDLNSGLIVIKPSGVDYSIMKPQDMVVLDLMGNIIEGNLKPSSDTQTHIEIYKNFKDIMGITHTHSTNAVAFAQAGMSIPALGTTHADYFCGDIPCTRCLSIQETQTHYELNTGKVIVETIKELGIKSLDIPGILVKNHGPFTWGINAKQSVYHSVVLEKIAEMAIKTLLLNPQSQLPYYILNKHYERKHGKNAYYGQ